MFTDNAVHRTALVTLVLLNITKVDSKILSQPGLFGSVDLRHNKLVRLVCSTCQGAQPDHKSHNMVESL